MRRDMMGMGREGKAKDEMSWDAIGLDEMG